MKNVVVYTHSNHLYSSLLIEWLEEQDILFKEKNIGDLIHLAEAKSYGKTYDKYTMPMVIVDGQLVTMGYDMKTKETILQKLRSETVGTN